MKIIKLALSKKNHILAIALSVLIVTAYSVYPITSAINEPATKEVKLGNVNKTYEDKGWDDVEKNKDLPNIFVLEYLGAFDGIKYVSFNKSIDKLETMVKKGDKLVLKITSSGGSAVACTNLASRLDNVAEEFQLETVSIIDLAALSCGYELAVSSDIILSSKGAMIGNIGSYIKRQADFSGNNASGNIIIGSTRTKEIMGGDLIRSELDRAVIKGMVTRSHAIFIQYIIDSRSHVVIDPSAFDGRYFYHDDALRLGLVDGESDSYTYLRKLHQKGYEITEL